MHGTQRALAELVQDNRGWVALGQVTAVEAHDAWGYLLTVTLQPSGAECQARPVHAGAGDARGDFWPVDVDDEVLVLFPDGDPNRAVALVGVTSAAAGIPSSWDNAQPQFVHPSGKEFRTSESASVQALVTEDLLAKIAALAGEVAAIGAGIPSGSAVPTPTASELFTMAPTAYRTVALKSE
jgi:phage baseplate assembly protein gpV